VKIGIVSEGRDVAEAAQNGRITVRLIGEVLDRNHSKHSSHSFIASYKSGSGCKLTVFVGEVSENEKEMVYQMHDCLKIMDTPLSFITNFS